MGLSRVETQKKRREDQNHEKKQARKVWLSWAFISKEEARQYLEDNTSKDELMIIKEVKSNDYDDSDHENSAEVIIPARTETYYSNKIKLSRIFLNTLIVLFLMLTAALLWWGLEGAPPLKEIWK
ncbi:hypothetical protein [Paenibacillus crassostreae]|uniref:Uncharacterized protein n=1 Tax=Paenibacillus crassostreae TaxID=1763538 RepID=A0A167DJC0_9BACL|nr:hypothetical protein [Paenibacillus crassostreae]AOZ91396.1 hypothetical protein LPB68_03700 [Paenibacillus crassostreae]OAB74444.1 hypothetical protein PNBC_10260 [Paenibacillus crassostreae]